jgi:hypothetical protein
MSETNSKMGICAVAFRLPVSGSNDTSPEQPSNTGVPGPEPLKAWNTVRALTDMLASMRLSITLK